MMRQNKATVSDTAMGDAFHQGFEEGVVQAGMEMVYELRASFEGTELRRLTFSDLDTVLAEAKELLRHGPGAQISIMVYPKSTPHMTTPEAVAEAEVVEIEDAEVVEDSPDKP